MELVALYALAVLGGFVGAARLPRWRPALLALSILLLLAPVALVVALLLFVDWSNVQFG